MVLNASSGLVSRRSEKSRIEKKRWNTCFGECLCFFCSDTWTAEDDRTVLSCHAFSKADIDWLAGDGPRPFHAWCESAQNGGLKLVALKSMERVFLDVETTGYTGNDFE